MAFPETCPSSRRVFIAAFIVISCLHLNTAGKTINDYSVTWRTQEWDPQDLIPPAYGSMPTGNGDVGANVWCKNDTLHLMICKSDAWLDRGDESLLWYGDGEVKTHNQNIDRFNLVKLGVLDITFSPNPFRDGTFSQALNMEEGHIEVSGAQTGIRIWADANASVLHVEAASETPFTMNVSVQGTYADNNELVWIKRDTTTAAYVAECFETQGISSEHGNPMENLTSGWIMRGEGFAASGNTLSKTRTATSASVHLYPLVMQTPGDAEWLAEARARAEAVDQTPVAEAFAAHKAWWSSFWDRSHVIAEGDADADTITRIYFLQRYINACSGRGKYPIKFNGGLFLVHDSRRWGPPYWVQNTRHIYWPMLPSGDFDLMANWFKMVTDLIPVRKDNTAFRFPGTRGMYLPETFYFYGTYRNWDYKKENPYTFFHFNGNLEIVAMMAERYWYTLDDNFLSRVLVPFADEVLKFFDTNFPRKNGKLFIEDVSSLETYWNINNPTPDIAGLKRCLNLLLAIPEGAYPDSLRARWTRFKGEIPDIPLSDGALAHYESGESEVHNSEHPAVYAIWPFRQYGVGLPELDIAQKTLARNGMGKRRGSQRVQNGGWSYRAIEAAYGGITDVMEERLIWNFEPQPIPGSWGSSYYRFVGWDWSIDGDQEQCGNNAATTALYASIVQEAAGKFHLLPTWPLKWDVRFKVRQFYRTIMEGVYDADTKKLTLTVRSAKDLSPEDIVLREGVEFADGGPGIVLDSGATVMGERRRSSAGSVRIDVRGHGLVIHTRGGPHFATVFDAMGRPVHRFSGVGPVLSWDGIAEDGSAPGAGWYVVRVTSAGARRTASLVLAPR